MANEMFVVMVGVFGLYILLKLLSRKTQKKPIDLLSKVLTGEEHKVKGQWEK